MLSLKEIKNSGFTIIEALIALFLGTTLSSGIIAMYINNTNSYVQDEEIARLQENARFAINILKREITMSGFIAGIPDYSDITSTSVNNDCVNLGNWATDLSRPLELINNIDTSGGIQTINGTTWNCFTASDIINQSDIISVKRTADRPTIQNGNLESGVSEDNDQWYLRVFNYTESKNWQYISSASPIPSAEKTNNSKIDYWEYYSKIFFLRDYAKTTNDGIPTLCAKELSGNTMSTKCYIRGVEDMQLEIGIDSDGDAVPDLYKASPTSTEIAEAVTVRVHLLMRSIYPINSYTNSKSYNLGEKTIAAKNDAYLRRVFSTTVQMRNAVTPGA